MADEHDSESPFGDFLAAMEARDEADSLDRAIAWTVVSTDLSFPAEPQATLLVGVFDNVGDALRHCAEYSMELNDGREEGDGWNVYVKPIMPADPIPMFAGSTPTSQPVGADTGAPVLSHPRTGAPEYSYGEGKTYAGETNDSLRALGLACVASAGIFAAAVTLVVWWATQ
jgi:hypothetical protein